MPRTTSKRRSPGGLGTVRQLPSGRFRAYYRHDGDTFTAPHTFDTREAATGWLASERAERALGTWRDPRLGQITLEEYAQGWLASRADLAPNTRDLYQRLLDTRVLPPAGTTDMGRLDLGRLPLASIAPATSTSWYRTVSMTVAAGKPR